MALLPTAPVRVLAFLDAPTKLWVAVCLELGFAARAKTLDEIGDSFVRAYRAQVRLAERLGEKPFGCAVPAPDKYERAYEDARLWREIELGDPLWPKAVIRAVA